MLFAVPSQAMMQGQVVPTSSQALWSNTQPPSQHTRVWTHTLAAPVVRNPTLLDLLLQLPLPNVAPGETECLTGRSRGSMGIQRISSTTLPVFVRLLSSGFCTTAAGVLLFAPPRGMSTGSIWHRKPRRHSPQRVLCKVPSVSNIMGGCLLTART